MGDTLAGAGIGGAIGVVAASILAPEVTIPALIAGGVIGGAGGAGLGYAFDQLAGTPGRLTTSLIVLAGVVLIVSKVSK